jgi:hypothetical protein
MPMKRWRCETGHQPHPQLETPNAAHMTTHISAFFLPISALRSLASVSLVLVPQCQYEAPPWGGTKPTPNEKTPGVAHSTTRISPLRSFAYVSLCLSHRARRAAMYFSCHSSTSAFPSGLVMSPSNFGHCDPGSNTSRRMATGQAMKNKRVLKERWSIWWLHLCHITTL